MRLPLAHFTVENWLSLAGPTITLVSLIGRIVTGKLNAIGEHLAAQDHEREQFREQVGEGFKAIGERVSRLEGREGIRGRS